MSALRVGRIAALNMYPVYHGLAAVAGPELTFTDGHPTELNGALVRGDLDVSAMSSIAFARNADRLTLVPVASITAEGAVDSIRVFSRVPFDRLRRVAVTPHSATSVALLRILTGPQVSFVPLTQAPRRALEHVDGVLLIGDEALAGVVRPFAPYSTDLGAEWSARTGHPMVYAVWAARTPVARERPEAVAALGAMLRGARARYAADPEAVVAAAAERFPFPADFIRRYFRRLRYGFGPAERAGLAAFLELARESGELRVVPPLAA